MKNLFLTIAFIVGWCASYAATPEYNGNQIAPHPRLLLHKNGERDIKKAIKDYPELNLPHQRIMEFSEQCLNQPTQQRIKQGKRLLGVSREVLKRVFFLSYAYRMTGDKKYAKRAEEEMLAAANFSDWNPSHFLDVGEMAMGLAIGYDWLYDYLSPESRKIIREAIRDKALKEPDNNPGYAWFYNVKNNWNSVCNGGLVYGALAIYEDEPELSKKIIDKSFDTNHLAMEGFGPDGGYPEGFEYWEYGTSFQVMLIAALESALGSDFGYNKAPGFLESARFMGYMTTPTGYVFNYSDTGNPNHPSSMTKYWFAKKLNDPSVVYPEHKLLTQANPKVSVDRLLPAWVIYATQVNPETISAPENNFWFNRGDTHVYIYRGGWGNVNDTYLGVNAGSPRTSHAHMDAGNFIYEKDGVRWTSDLGSQNYLSIEQQGVDLWNQNQDGQRWDIYRLGPLSHNTLIVNGRKHRVDGKSEIVDTLCSPIEKGAVVNITPALADGVKSAVRRITLDADDNLTVVDSITAPDHAPAFIQWQIVTQCDVTITPDKKIWLTRDGKSMLLTPSAGDLDITVKEWPVTTANNYDYPNPGFSRVGFTTTVPSGKSAVLKVTFQ